MPAPAGLCEFCNTPLKWRFAGDVLMVRCADCLVFDLGIEYAGNEAREGHETMRREVRFNG